MTPHVRVISSEDRQVFEQTLNTLLADGYKIATSCCGVVPRTVPPPGYYIVYSAVMLQEDEP
jgi:hypothetical protein